jgi:restriction system protein
VSRYSSYAAAQRRAAAAAVRAKREAEREQRRLAALERKHHLEDRQAEVDGLNNDLAEQVHELGTLLHSGLDAAAPLDFGSLKRAPDQTPFQPGKLAVPEPAPTVDKYLPVPLEGLASLLPWQKKAHAKATELALRRFDDDVKRHQQREAVREKSLAAARTAYDAALQQSMEESEEWNNKIDEFAREYATGVPSAVIDYCRLALEQSDYPNAFPKGAKIAYTAQSKQIVVEYDCPTIDVVPEVAAYKYVKGKDEVTSTVRPAAQRRTLYTSVVAQVTLRTLHELFAADAPGHADTIVFNGHVNAVDKGTGQKVYPCIVTVRTTRDAFSKLNLAAVDPQACLKTLSASVSPSPSELVAVRPVLEFKMTDPRFVEEADVLSTLDQRPNLMELSPTEFESLITNLFEKMGLETRQTQASRDGGVDCVAYDNRPIFGGKVIIQAKRYKNTVGVSAVRDLFGTLQNEGASKGILVTTSGYGKAAFDFANGKPLELLEGSHLLYLLEQHAGIKAKIVVPETWKDPVLDVADQV